MGRKQVLTLDNFSGGMNVRDGFRGLKNTELQFVQDMYCENGQLKQVRGASGRKTKNIGNNYHGYYDVVGLDNDFVYVAVRVNSSTGGWYEANPTVTVYKVENSDTFFTDDDLQEGPGISYRLKAKETLPIIWPTIRFGDELIFFPISPPPFVSTIKNHEGDDVGNLGSNSQYYAPAAFAQRLFVRVDDEHEYRFCGINNYDTWNDHLVLEGREKPICSVPFSGNLFVFGEENTHVIFGRSALSFGTRRLLDGFTTYHANSIQTLGNRIVFLGRDNKLYSWDGTINHPRSVSEKVNWLFRNIPGHVRSSFLGNRYYLSIRLNDLSMIEGDYLNLVFDFDVIDREGQPYVAALSFSPKFMSRPGFRPGTFGDPNVVMDAYAAFSLGSSFYRGLLEDSDQFFDHPLIPEIKTGGIDFGAEVIDKRLTKVTFGVNRFSKFTASYMSRSLIKHVGEYDSGDNYTREGLIPAKAGINGKHLSIGVKKTPVNDPARISANVQGYFEATIGGEHKVYSVSSSHISNLGYRGPTSQAPEIHFGEGSLGFRPDYSYSSFRNGEEWKIYALGYDGRHDFGQFVNDSFCAFQAPETEPTLYPAVGLPFLDYQDKVWHFPTAWVPDPEDRSKDVFVDRIATTASFVQQFPLTFRVYNNDSEGDPWAVKDTYSITQPSNTQFRRNTYLTEFNGKMFAFYETTQYNGIAYRELPRDIGTEAEVVDLVKVIYKSDSSPDDYVLVPGPERARNMAIGPQGLSFGTNTYYAGDYCFVTGRANYFVVIDKDFNMSAPYFDLGRIFAPTRITYVDGIYYYFGDDVWYSLTPMIDGSWKRVGFPRFIDGIIADGFVCALCNDGNIAITPEPYDKRSIRLQYPAEGKEPSTGLSQRNRLAHYDGILYIIYDAGHVLAGKIDEIYNGLDGIRSINLEFEAEAL